ncbi:MAG: PQQ-binding-like beta-propeller repeat protein [Pirellulales bacterium]
MILKFRQPPRRLLVIILGALLYGLTGVAASALAADSPAIDPMDWPHWRGPEQNGISREKGLISEWDPAAEGTAGNVLWKNTELGGISTPVVLRGKLYTIVRSEPGTKLETEKVVCVDALTGKKVWENKYNVYLSDVPAERVGWSCCTADPTTGKIYALGSCGYLMCLDGETGKTLWDTSLNEEYGFLTTYGGRLTTPVIFEDLVIASGVIIGWGDMARPTHRLLAFNKENGELVWINGTRPLPEDTTYSSPVTTVLNGQAALVFGSGDGAVHAWQPRTGNEIWQFVLSPRGLNLSPIVDGNHVFMAQAEENVGTNKMGTIVGIDGSKTGNITKTGQLWRQTGMVGKSSPLLIDGRLYAFDDGAKLYVIDAATGKMVGKPVKLVGTILRASPVYADGKIYVCSTSAWHVIEPTKTGAKLVNRMRLTPEDEVSGSIAVSHGRIYLPTGAAMYCLGRPDVKPAATPQPEQPKEAPMGEDSEPSYVQVVPAELLLRPGQKQKLTVRLFNDRGQLLKTTDAKFTLNGPGEVSADGTYVAASAPAHTATMVKAKVGDLEGQARIRVVPDLPWRFDFEQGDVPITWVGARYRNVLRKVDGNSVMVKITTIPKGTRSQALMGHDDLHDYTIQADVQGVTTNGRTPDIGLIAQRYTMDLMGDHQEIQIRSWTSQLDRFSKTVPFAWEGDTWYTMKFRAAVEDGKAVLKGKVWKRGEQEPEAWTIEAVDEAPNVAGSPGLFGNAQTSEIYIDNISVTKN